MNLRINFLVVFLLLLSKYYFFLGFIYLYIKFDFFESEFYLNSLNNNTRLENPESNVLLLGDSILYDLGDFVFSKTYLYRVKILSIF